MSNSNQDQHSATNLQNELKKRKQIAVVWTIEDVQEIRSDLDDEQAWRVLQACDGNHDATIGINWEVIEEYAEFFYPKQTADSR